MNQFAIALITALPYAGTTAGAGGWTQGMGGGPALVGIVIDDNVDWDEVGELLTESYRMLAPRRLVDALDRQAD